MKRRDDQDEDVDDGDDDDGDGDDEGEGNDDDPLHGDCLTLCFPLIIPVGHLELLCSFRPSSCFVVSPFHFLLFSISCSAIDTRLRMGQGSSGNQSYLAPFIFVILFRHLSPFVPFSISWSAMLELLTRNSQFEAECLLSSSYIAEPLLHFQT